MQDLYLNISFLYVDYPTKIKKLKKSAVPSLNLPEVVPKATLKKRVNDQHRNVRILNRRHKKELESKKEKPVDDVVPAVNLSVEVPDADVFSEVRVKDVLPIVPVEVPVENNLPVEVPKSNVQDKEVQVQFELYKKFVNSEKDLNTLTGLQSFYLLNLFEDVVIIVDPKTSKYYSKSELSIKDRIVLTCIKLKQNISYSMLCVLFNVCTEQTCRKIFLRMISILGTGLKFAIHWPSREEVLRNIPTCFYKYRNVRAVIDVIEINIQSPKNLCCQIGTYSSYKSSNTVRFMTAVSPGGLITYISKAFLGRSSDKAIFEKSNFIKLFESGDGLMTDKGFLIDDVCQEHNVQLIRPPFLRNKVQFSKEEALLNATIAKARVHVERSNQRLKVFKILSSKVPSYLVPRIDQIFVIISAIVNLSSPILKDDKFNN